MLAYGLGLMMLMRILLLSEQISMLYSAAVSSSLSELLQQFPAARTAATRALVVVNMSNEAVNGAFVICEGADDVDCDDDAPE